MPGRPYVITVSVESSGFGVSVEVAEASSTWEASSAYSATIASVRSIRLPSSIVGSWTNIDASGKSWSGEWWVGNDSPGVREGARLEWRWDNADDSKDDARLGLSTMHDGVLHERLAINKNGNVGMSASSGVNRVDIGGGVAVGNGIAGSSAAPLDGMIVVGDVGVSTDVVVNAMEVGGGVSMGSSFASSAAPTDGLAVAGRVGVGTQITTSSLDIAGSVVIGTSAAGSAEAPASGLLIEGSVGVGTSSPRGALDVAGGMSVGASYAGSTQAPTSGMLIEGTLGVGTSSVVNSVDIEGGVAIGSRFSGSSVAPEDGLIVEGSVGIGIDTPLAPLHVVQLDNTREQDTMVEMMRIERDASDIKHNSANAEGAYVSFALSDAESSWNFFPDGMHEGMEFTFSGLHDASGFDESIDFLGEGDDVIFRMNPRHSAGLFE